MALDRYVDDVDLVIILRVLRLNLRVIDGPCRHPWVLSAMATLLETNARIFARMASYSTVIPTLEYTNSFFGQQVRESHE